MRKNPLKAHIGRIHYCVPLTIAQWDMLTVKERLDMDCVHCKSLEKWGKDVSHIEFNGHFGCNFFFSDTGSPKRMLRRLTSLLKIHPAYTEGLKAGENGYDLKNPYKIPYEKEGASEHERLQEAMFTEGWEVGKNYGSQVALTMNYDQIRAKRGEKTKRV